MDKKPAERFETPETGVMIPVPSEVHVETPKEAAARKAAHRKANGMEQKPGGGFGAFATEE